MRASVRKPCIGCGSSCYKKNCAPEVLPVKLTQSNRPSKLSPVNAKDVTKWVDATFGDTPYFFFISMVADLLDTALVQDNVYMTVGLTRDKSSLMFKVHSGQDSQPAYGSTFEELAQAAESLL